MFGDLIEAPELILQQISWHPYDLMVGDFDCYASMLGVACICNQRETQIGLCSLELHCCS